MCRLLRLWAGVNGSCFYNRFTLRGHPLDNAPLLLGIQALTEVYQVPCTNAPRRRLRGVVHSVVRADTYPP
jgi:hypothetical protein